jgi:hypothetical protein
MAQRFTIVTTNGLIKLPKDCSDKLPASLTEYGKDWLQEYKNFQLWSADLFI